MEKILKYFLIVLIAFWIAAYCLSFTLSGDLILLPLVSLTIVISFIVSKKYNKFSYVVIALISLIAIELFLLWYPYMEFIRIELRFIFFTITLAMTIIGRYIFTSVKHFGRGFLIMLGIFAISVLFKRLHWPGASPLLVISITSISLMYLIQMIYSFSFLKNNKLLFITGFSCSFIITHFFLGWLFKSMHWPGGGFFYYNTVHYFHIAFVICSVILLVGVQITDFTTWIVEQRNFLVRNILIPWFFIFIMAGWFFLFRDSFESTFVQKSYNMSHPWGMVDYELKEK